MATKKENPADMSVEKRLETLYQLQEVSILPFMGSGSNEYEGYTFLPDGSGTIFRYEEICMKGERTDAL